MFRLIKKGCIPAISVCVICPAICAAQPTTAPSQSDTASQVQELRSEVQDLRARLDAQSSNASASGGMTGASTQPDVSSAGTPASAAQQQANEDRHNLLGLHAGWDLDKGFIIRSSDDSFLLHPWFFTQFRYAADYRSNASATTGSDTENGFEMPRAKVIFDGNVFSRDLTYQVIWSTVDTSGNLMLQDAWARYHIPSTPFAIEGGQIRNPVDHEQLLFATKSLTPDRSIVNNILLNGDDIVKGASLSYGYDMDAIVRGQIAFTSGQRNFDTTFEGYPTNPATWGTAGRVEWKLCGNWKDYTQFTALGDQTPLLVLGGGLDYTEAGAAGALTHVADVQYDSPCGTLLYAAYLGRYTRDDAGAPTTNGQFSATSTGRADTYDATGRVMVAQLLDERFEPFVRYEYIQFDSREFAGGVNPSVHDISLGCNYYLYGHHAKFTGSVSYLPNGSPVDNTISDLLASHRGNEFLLQVQLQLML